MSGSAEYGRFAPLVRREEVWLNRRFSIRALTIYGAMLAATAVLFGMSGCSSGSAGTDAVATVNGKKLLRSDMEKYYKQQLAGATQQPEG